MNNNAKNSDRAKILKYARKQYLYLFWLMRYYKKTTQFRNKYKNQSCFIIGNGPSLNQMDLSLLFNKYTFGLNKIHLIFDRVDLNLNFHVAVNPYVIQQSCQEFSEFSFPSFLSYESILELSQQEKVKLLNNTRVCPVMTRTPLLHFSNCLEKRISEGFTVTFAAMQIAYYLGFKNVFLIGVDHNFSCTGSPNELQTMNEEDKNHFSPNYFQGMQWQLPDLEGSELAYRLADFHFKRDGRLIRDATLNGKLSIFPKIDYLEALEMCDNCQE